MLTVPEALSEPQVRDRGMVATFENAPGVGRDIRVVRSGVKINGAAPAVSAPPPRLGEHSRDILAELGLSAAEIDRLVEEKVL